MSELPTIIKDILIETYYDFENVDIGNDISKVNLKNILRDVKNGKDKLNIFESSVLFEFFYNGYKEFKLSKQLDTDRLKSDTLNYYNELHKQHYDDIDFKLLDRTNPATFIIMKDSINCENFILIHYIKSNFNIVYMGD